MSAFGALLAALGATTQSGSHQQEKPFPKVPLLNSLDCADCSFSGKVPDPKHPLSLLPSFVSIWGPCLCPTLVWMLPIVMLRELSPAPFGQLRFAAELPLLSQLLLLDVSQAPCPAPSTQRGSRAAFLPPPVVAWLLSPFLHNQLTPLLLGHTSPSCPPARPRNSAELPLCMAATATGAVLGCVGAASHGLGVVPGLLAQSWGVMCVPSSSMFRRAAQVRPLLHCKLAAAPPTLPRATPGKITHIWVKAPGSTQ